MEYRSVEACWRHLRSTRAELPGYAAIPGRADVYVTALEQAEQFFRASETVGYETRPVLLFYGLSQAARAMSAAISPTGEDWELNGHGITCPGLNDTNELGCLQVIESGKEGASFKRIAARLGSPGLPRRVKLREVWASLPDAFEYPLQGSEECWSAVRLEGLADGDEWDRVIHSASLYGRLDLINAVANLDSAARNQLLHSKFPNLYRFEVRPRESDGKVSILVNAWSRNGRTSLWPRRREFRDVKGVAEQELVGYGHPLYRSPGSISTWLIPTVGGNSEPLDPVLTWWALLFSLSMLARYRPSQWSRMIDIDQSHDASAVEGLLQVSHQACANLISHVIETGRWDYINSV